MNAITADRVRKLCRAIRTRTDTYSMDMRHWLRDLDQLQECGWSPDALPTIQLDNDAKTLRALATALETARTALIQPEPETRKPDHA